MSDYSYSEKASQDGRESGMATGTMLQSATARISGYLTVQINDQKFDERFLDLMRQKTNMIDISKISLYIDVIQKNKGDEKENENYGNDGE